MEMVIFLSDVPCLWNQNVTTILVDNALPSQIPNVLKTPNSIKSFNYLKVEKEANLAILKPKEEVRSGDENYIAKKTNN